MHVRPQEDIDIGLLVESCLRVSHRVTSKPSESPPMKLQWKLVNPDVNPETSHPDIISRIRILQALMLTVACMMHISGNPINNRWDQGVRIYGVAL